MPFWPCEITDSLPVLNVGAKKIASKLRVTRSLLANYYVALERKKKPRSRQELM